MTARRSGDGALAGALREAVRTGDWAAIGARLAPGAVLDTSSERGRRRVRGRAAIVAHIAAAGPGEVVDWTAREWEAGAAVTFEWRGASGVDRRRWYLRRAGDRIGAWWSYAARPRSGAQASAVLPDAVLAQLGPGAERAPLAHGGNSGAALERVRLPDGRALVAKRVGPEADWLGRATHDRGRTALLWAAGAFGRMPAGLDHGVEAVLEDGDGWWVVMRDLGPALLGDERRLTRAESRRVLGVAGALHAAFAGAPPDGA